MSYDVLPESFATPVQRRPARPQISTSPVRMVDVKKNLPKDVGDERAAELDAMSAMTAPQVASLVQRVAPKPQPAAAPAGPTAGRGQPSQFIPGHTTGGAVTKDGMRHEVGAYGAPNTKPGAATRGGVTKTVPQGPTAPRAGTATRGDRTITVPPQPPAPTPGMDAGKALGFSSRGGTVPRGNDALDGSNGLFSQRFASRTAGGPTERSMRRAFDY